MLEYDAIDSVQNTVVSRCVNADMEKCCKNEVAGI